MGIPRPVLTLLLVLALQPADAFVLAIDLGSQFFKAAIVAPGRPFEVVHNTHSKRKTPTAVSFQEVVRTFGDDAVSSAAKGVGKTPMFFTLALGKNFSGISEEKLSLLSPRYFPYDLGLHDSGSLLFRTGQTDYTVQEVTAHLLNFAQELAEATVDGVAVSEAILTVPSSATMLHRRALLDAAKIAGLPRPQLIHETSAAALHRALDLSLGGAGSAATNTSEEIRANRSTVLFFNMGSRHVEACVVDYQGATYQNKDTVAMNVAGCGTSASLGGHQVDLIIADQMLESFKAKHPKLKDVDKSVRALKKLEKQALALKHVLSANKEGLFRVESLYEDTDFAQQVTRDQLESWTADLFSDLRKPLEDALRLASKSFDDLEAVEMVGGGWRIPKIQSMLVDYLKERRSQDATDLVLSQHVNGDEAMATGGAWYGVNSSVSFRAKKIYFTDMMIHAYDLLLEPLNASQPHESGWMRGVELFPALGKLRAKKTVKMNISFDLKATLLENGTPICYWEFPGIYAATQQYEDLKEPLISLKFELSGSGVVQVSSATAIFDQPMPVKSIDKNTPLENESAEEENSSNVEEEADSIPQADSDGDGAEGTKEDSKEGQPESNGEATNKEPKIKIKKLKVPLDVAETFDGIYPRFLSAEEKSQARNRLLEMREVDKEIQKTNAVKNQLESYIYESRDKITDENSLVVSTEEQRSAVMEQLQAMEDWMWEEEAQMANATVLQQKLSLLQDHVRPILQRAHEMEQRALLPELVDKIWNGVNATLGYVMKNMTWVAEKETSGVADLMKNFTLWYENVTNEQVKRDLTQDPAFYAIDAMRRLEHMRLEAVRLTKIKKVDPVPYSDAGRDYWKDPKMREFYEQYYKNFSRNGTNYSEFFRNFNFSDFNFSGNGSGDSDDYMRSFRDFYKSNTSEKKQDENSTENAGSKSEDNDPSNPEL